MSLNGEERAAMLACVRLLAALVALLFVAVHLQCALHCLQCALFIVLHLHYSRHSLQCVLFIALHLQCALFTMCIVH